MRRSIAVVALSAMLVAASSLVFAPSSAQAAPMATLPPTPVGVQASWLLKAIEHLPISTGTIDAHFDATFLSEASPSALNNVFEGAGSLTFVSVTSSSATELVFIVRTGASTDYKVSMGVDAKGLIYSLLISAVVALPPSPTSWATFDTLVQSVAPKVRVLVAKVDGSSCQIVHTLHATTVAPLGSTFKLYVLDALATLIATGKVTWNQELEITQQLKSLPSGVLQSDPDGT
jgi:hypothetical protein